MTDYVDSPTSDASKTAGRTRAKVEPKLKAVSGAAHDAYDSLRDIAVEAVDETRARLKDIAAQASDQFQHRYGAVEAWVHEKPARAVGVAAGLGIVLGLLLRGRSTRTIYVREPR